MFNGKVKWFNGKKGYGFIERSEGETDLFVHFSDIVMDGYKQLNPGDEVEFDVAEGDKGPKAILVKVTNEKTN